MAMHIVKVVKDFGDILVKDEKTGKELPKYGFRPQLGKLIRLNDHDYNMCKKDKLVVDLTEDMKVSIREEASKKIRGLKKK